MIPNQNEQWVVAHRGVSEHCPENSRAAFQAALASRADAIECDLQLTADTEIVVCHDSTLTRYGHPDVVIADTPWSDLQTRDVGRWLAPEFADQRLLRLEDLLAEFGHQIPLWLEVKNADISPERTTAFLKRLARNIEAENLTERTAILCFDTKVLQQFRDLAPWATLVRNTHHPGRLSAEKLRSQPWLNAVDANIKHLNEQAVQTLKEQNLHVFCFTCTTEEDARRAWQLGVQAVIANDPERIRISRLQTQGAA